MNDIASRMVSSLPQIARQGLDSATAAAVPAAASPVLDTKVRVGTGALSQRMVAVGDGQTAQRMQESRASRALLAGASPAIRAMLADGAAGPGPHGVLHLKERQLGNGGGQGTP